MSINEQLATRTFGQKIASVLSGILLVLAGFFAGAVLGGLYVKLFVPRAAMGWDGIADAMGGLMLGGLIGVMVCIVLTGVLAMKRRLQFAGVLFGVVLLVIAWGVITNQS